jgi:hypothetical protein
MPGATVKIAFLIGRTDISTTRVIACVCGLEQVETVAVLLDTAIAPVRQRWRNARRNIRREGISYVLHRALHAAKEKLEEWADQVIPQREVAELLTRAFPEYSLNQLAQKYGFAYTRLEILTEN